MFGLRKEEVEPQVQTLPRAVLMVGEVPEAVPGELITEEVLRLAVEGAEIHKRMKKDEARLEAIGKKLKDVIKPGSTLLIDGVAQVPVYEMQGVSVADGKTLRDFLGERFASHVDTTYSLVDGKVAELKELLAEQWEEFVAENYKATEKLKKRIADGDDPDRNTLRRCMDFGKRTTVLKYLAAKDLPETL
jgi:hypothetical protein